MCYGDWFVCGMVLLMFGVVALFVLAILVAMIIEMFHDPVCFVLGVLTLICVYKLVTGT